MTDTIDTYDGSYPYTPRYLQINGFRMHYVDEGPADAPTLLCLHGEPTWGYLFRHIVHALSGQHRVIVPDHMGFGRSETPPDRSYLLQDHIDNIERFVLALDLRDITLVMHDFGGPVGMGLAARHPDRIRAIASINAPTPFGQAQLLDRLTRNAQTSPWFQWILQAAAQGRLENVLSELGYNILSTLKLNGFERNDLINDTWLRAYGARFATPADCAGAIGWARGFADDAHRFEVPDAAARKAIEALPALAIWGMADRTLQAEHFLPLLRDSHPRARIHTLQDAGHYSLEDAPQPILHKLQEFLEQPS